MDRSSKPPGDGDALRVVVPIYGLSLGGCGAQVLERRLRATPGVVEAYVNPATEMVYVTFDPVRTAPGGLLETIAAAGYRAGSPEVWPRPR